MSEEGYTHRPGRVEEERGSDGDSDAEYGDDTDRGGDGDFDGDATDRDADGITDPSAPVERGREEWDWRGWTLVGVVVVAFLVVPATILYLPPVRPYRFAYLVLPMIPAILLGATAVWSAQRSG